MMKRILAATIAAAALTLSGVAASSASAYGLCTSTVRQHSRVYWTVMPNDQPFAGYVEQLHQKTGTATVAWDAGYTSYNFPVSELTTCNPEL